MTRLTLVEMNTVNRHLRAYLLTAGSKHPVNQIERLTRHLNGEAMTSIARQEGVSIQAVNRSVRALALNVLKWRNK